MVPMDVSTTESKSLKSTAPGTEVVRVPGGLMVKVSAFAGLTANTHAPATSATLSFDFIVKLLSMTYRCPQLSSIHTWYYCPFFCKKMRFFVQTQRQAALRSAR